MRVPAHRQRILLALLVACALRLVIGWSAPVHAVEHLGKHGHDHPCAWCVDLALLATVDLPVDPPPVAEASGPGADLDPVPVGVGRRPRLAGAAWARGPPAGG